EAQGFEFVLGQLARKAPRDLIAKLRRPLRNEGAIEFIISIHWSPYLLRVKPPLPKALPPYPRGGRALQASLLPLRRRTRGIYFCSKMLSRNPLRFGGGQCE